MTRIPPPAASAAALAALLVASPAARAASPDALWNIVHGRCVPNQQLHNAPSPCTSVSLAGGEAHGYAILKDIKGASQFLLIPTDRITGIESPKILADDAPNYFAAAWAARSGTEAVFHHPLPREDISLAINSPLARSQNQLHIHIDCLQPAVVAALHAHAAAIGPSWAPLPVPLQGHPYRAKWLPESALAASNPFKLLAADVGAPAMKLQTLIVAGAVSPSGQPGFVLLADHADPTLNDHAGGEELQDHSCTVAYKQ